MNELLAALILFVSFSEIMVADLAGELLSEVTWATGINMIFMPTILSGALALLVKYLAALRIVPVYKLVTGGLMVLLVSWYIDRICRNNSYLLVRSVGLGLILCAGVGVVIVSEDRFAQRPVITAQRTASAQPAGEQEFGLARD
jgi:hypothetical protein